MRDSPASSSRGGATSLPGVSPIDEAAASWVGRIENGLTVAEEDELADWLAADARHEASFQKYQAAWDRFAPMAEAVVSDRVLDPDRFVSADTLGNRLRSTAAAKPRGRAHPLLHRWIVPALGLAAAIALLLFVLPERHGSPARAPIALPALCEQRMLSDGSVVQLNRGAEVTADFSDAERRIRLERGEAIFTVARNPDRPFIVTAGTIEIRALGTAFNVRIAPAAVEVVVTEGTVQLGGSPPDNGATTSSVVNAGQAVAAAPSATATVVTAGQSALVALAASASPAQVTRLTPDEMEARLAWQPRILNFDDAPLSAIIGEFNRRNPVHLVVNDPIIASRRMTATFRSDNLEAFVRLLEANIGVQAERLNDTDIALVRR